MAVNKIGNKSVRKALRRWGEEVVYEVKRIVISTAMIVQAEARLRAPEDSGFLRESIEIEILDNGLSAMITVGASYSIFIEFGTGIHAVKGNGRKTPWVFYSEKYGEWIWTEGMRAQPFWFDALDIGRKHFKKEMRKLGR